MGVMDWLSEQYLGGYDTNKQKNYMKRRMALGAGQALMQQQSPQNIVDVLGAGLTGAARGQMVGEEGWGDVQLKGRMGDIWSQKEQAPKETYDTPKAFGDVMDNVDAQNAQAQQQQMMMMQNAQNQGQPNPMAGMGQNMEQYMGGQGAPPQQGSPMGDVLTPPQTDVQGMNPQMRGNVPNNMADQLEASGRAFMQSGRYDEGIKLLSQAENMRSGGGGDIRQTMPSAHTGFEETFPVPSVLKEAGYKTWKDLRGKPAYQEGMQEYLADMSSTQALGVDPETGDFVARASKGDRVTRQKVPSLVDPKLKSLSAESIKSMGTIRTTFDRLEELKGMAAADPAMFGPVAGNYQKIKQMFVDDAPRETIMRQTESMITLAYALSGKQISEREMQILKKAILPSITQPGGNFQAAIEHAQEWLKTEYTNQKDIYEQQRYIPPPELGADTGMREMPKKGKETAVSQADDHIKNLVTQFPDKAKAWYKDKAFDDRFAEMVKQYPDKAENWIYDKLEKEGY